MYSGFLHYVQVLCLRRIINRPTIDSSVPDTSNVIPRYDLYKMSGLHVTNFDKAGVEQQDIGCVHGNTNCCAFPLNYASWSPGFAFIVHEKPEFCSKVLVEAGYFSGLHTVITK